MNKQEVIDLIRTWIIQNGNQLITANILRPILEAMVNQPNSLIGDMTTLDTNAKSTLVGAINELSSQGGGGGLVIHEGALNPNETPPAAYAIGDFYLQYDDSLQGFFQYNGSEWARIENSVIADDLVTDNGEISLSARQGKLLKEFIDNLLDDVDLVVTAINNLALEVDEKANDSEVVKSISINGGESVLPNPEGLVDLLIELGVLERVTTATGTSYVLRGHNNIVTGEGSVILGRDAEDNGSLSFITGLGHKILTAEEYNSIVGGMNSTIAAAVRKHAIILGGQSNQILASWGGAIISGYNNKVSASYGVVIGGAENTVGALAWGSVISGAYSTLNSPYSFIAGYQITINPGSQNRGSNFAAGVAHTITGIGATVFGAGHSVTGNWATVVGQAALALNNVTTGNNANDLRFVVGNGTINLTTWAATARSNAFEVYHDGRIIAPSLTIAKIEAATGKVLVTKEFLEQYDGGGTSDVTKAYVDAADAALQGQIDTKEKKRTVKPISNTSQYTLIAEDFTDYILDFTANGGQSISVILNTGVAPAGGQIQAISSGNNFLVPTAGTGITLLRPEGTNLKTTAKGWIGLIPLSAANTFGVNGNLESTSGGGETYNVFTSTEDGLVPAGGSGTTKFLRQDGQWVVPPDTGGGETYNVFTNTEDGLVPAPNVSASGYSVAITSPTEDQTFEEGETITLTSTVTQTATESKVLKNTGWENNEMLVYVNDVLRGAMPLARFSLIPAGGTTITYTLSEGLPIIRIEQKAAVVTGTVLNLSNLNGITYNFTTPLSVTTYTVSSKAVNGFARVFVNAATEPTVTGGTKIAGADFIPNTKMEMVVETPDGVAVEYYFIER